MALLKSYMINTYFTNGVDISDLSDTIKQSSSVVNFNGCASDGVTVFVYGDSMNESLLDATVNSYVPNFVPSIIAKTVLENKVFADQLMQQIKEKNLLEGLNSLDQSAWVHHRLRKVSYLLSDQITTVDIDVMNLIVSGDIETAEQVMGQMSPDDMSKNYHWLTQERINWIRNEIRKYLG